MLMYRCVAAVAINASSRSLLLAASVNGKLIFLSFLSDSLTYNPNGAGE